MRKLNLIELFGMTDIHLILVETDFDLDIDEEAMMDIDWEKEPAFVEEFFDVKDILYFCRKNDIAIETTYWGALC